MNAQTSVFNCGNCELGLTGPTTKCSNAVSVGYYVVNDLPPTNIYTWTIIPAGDGTIVNNSNTVISVSWTNLTSTSQIVVTDSYCHVVETLCVRPCAATPAGYSGVFDPQTADLPGLYVSGSGFLTVTGGDLFLQGTFEVNQTLILDNCNILMGPGAVIIVNPNTNLHLLQTTIETQTVMWKGIETRQNSTLKLTNSIIRDALYGINLRGQYTALTLSAHNVFERNYIPIVTSVCPNQHIINTSFGFNQTFFDGNQGLKNPYDCQPPNTSTFTYSGMYLKDVDMLTTDYGTLNDRIHFTRLNNGIVSINSNITIRNCRFENIIALPFFNTLGITPAFNGSAVYTKRDIYYPGTTTDIGGTDTPTDIYSNTFTNCRRGVYVNNQNNCNITGNTFHGMTRAGVEITNCNQGNNQLNVTDNNFSNFMFGLRLRNIGSATTTVSYNDFVDGIYGTGGFTGTAIHITNSAIATVFLSLQYNNVGNTRIGLYGANISKANITGNIMQFEQDLTVLGNYKHYGMWLDNVDNSNLINNTIYRNLPNHLDLTTIDVQLKAFNFKDCQSDNLNTNTMTNMGTGMRFVDDNLNTQLYCNAFNRHKQGVFLQNAKMINQGGLGSPWDNTWNNFDATDLRAAGNAIGNPVNWYHRNSTVYTNNYAPEPHSPNSVNPLGNNNGFLLCLNPLEETPDALVERLNAIVDSTITYNINAAENRFKDLWFAYCILKGNDSLRNSDAALQNFVTAHAGSNVGELEYAEYQYQQHDYAGALATLSGVNPTNNVDYNKKYTLTLLAENPNLDAEDLTQNQLDDLTPIAYTTIWEGGDGVINARVIGTFEVDDEVNSLKIGLIPESNTPGNTFIIDNNFDVQQFVNTFNLKNHNRFTIYNTQGALVWQNNYAADFSNSIAKGVFLFRAIATNGSQISIKLVCLK